MEEPVFVTQRLYLDYTRLHPQAVFSFCGGVDGGVGLCEVSPEEACGHSCGSHIFRLSVALDACV